MSAVDVSGLDVIILAGYRSGVVHPKPSDNSWPSGAGPIRTATQGLFRHKYRNSGYVVALRSRSAWSPATEREISCP